MNGPINIPEFFQLAADRTGFLRDYYTEADMPTTLSNVTVMPFFGDYRSQFVLTSILLHRYLHNIKTGNYFILCSYPGLSGLFPYVDEYWSVADPGMATEMQERLLGPDTASERSLDFRRGLREFFRDIVTWGEDFSRYYDQGLTKGFFDTFEKVQVALPPLRSLRMDLNRQIASLGGYKLFVHPTKNVTTWQTVFKSGRTEKEFWRDLYDRLLKQGITPVVWQTPTCHDLSAEFAGRCVFFNDKNILDVLAAMRACHMVLDIHSGLSRYAAVARTPFLCVEERHKFHGLKDYELDDLCVANKAYHYIFSFITILEGNRWAALLDNIIVKLNSVLPVINRDVWPPTSEYFASVPYDVVRQKKSKRIGARFVKVPRM